MTGCDQLNGRAADPALFPPGRHRCADHGRGFGGQAARQRTDRGVHIAVQTRLQDLVPLGDGPDKGWTVAIGAGKDCKAVAAAAVVLASGRFEWNPPQSSTPGDQDCRMPTTIRR